MLKFDKYASELLQKYRFKSIFVDYFKRVFAIIIIPFIMFNIVTGVFLNYSGKRTENDYAKSITEKNASYLNRMFENVDTFYKECLSDERIAVLLSNSNLINNVAGGTSPIQKMANEVKILCRYTTSISEVFLYSCKADYVYSFVGSAFKSPANAEWYKEYRANDNKDYISAVIDTDEKRKIVFCYNIGNGVNPGVLVVQLSVNEIMNEMAVNTGQDGKFILSAVNTGKILLNAEGHSGNPIYSTELKSFPATLECYIENSDTNLLYLITIGISVLLSLIFAALLSYLFSRYQYANIVSAVIAIDNPECESKELKQNELFYIINKSKAFAIANQKLENQLIDKISAIKKSHIVALQTQINPHFLFNTLNMIVQSVYDDGRKELTIQMIERLSYILRYSLNTDEYIVSVNKEVEALKSYIEILQIKYDYSFDIEWDISSEVINKKTIKSIMQPMVENAVEHGIKRLYCKKKGYLKISVNVTEDKLYMTISDNGVGISPEKLSDIKSILLSEEIFQSKNIGLKNVASRINLLFEDTGGCEIQSTLGEGTTVTLYHPIIEI